MSTSNTEILKAILGFTNEDGTFTWKGEIKNGDVLRDLFDLLSEDGDSGSENEKNDSDLTVAKIIWDEYQEFIEVGFTKEQAFELVKAHCQSTWDAVAMSAE